MSQGFQKGHKGFRTRESYERMGLKLRGENHGNWVENPCYGSIHSWMIRNYPKIECEHCGKKKLDGWKLHYALKKGESHGRDRNLYLILCASCHKKYDYKEETSKKLSEYFKKNPVRYWLGKSRSEETKKKISLAWAIKK